MILFSRKFISYYFIFIISFLLNVESFSQTNRSKFEHITTEKGLSQNTVHSIIQDRKGFLWFATEDGLNKYDGFSFITYRNNPSDSTSLSDNFIWKIFEDIDGTIWICTNNGGLNRFENETESFTRFQHSPLNPFSISNNSIRAIYQDRKGNLWIGTEGGGLNKLIPGTNKFIRFPSNYRDKNSLTSNYVRAITSDDAGYIWIGTNGGGLNKFDPDNNVFIHFQADKFRSGALPNNNIWALAFDSDNYLWIGTDGDGLVKYNGNRFIPFRNSAADLNSIVNNVVTDIFEDQSGDLWISTEGGLCKFDKKKNKFDRFLNQPFDRTSLSNNFVRTVFEDRTGILWIGTVGGGVNKFIKEYKEITLYQHNPYNIYSLSSNMIRAINEDSDGNLWVGTLGGGLNKLKAGSDKFVNYKNDLDNVNSISDDGVTSIYEDRSGNLWIGTWGGGLNLLENNYRQKQSSTDLKFSHYFHDEYDENSLVSDIVQAINSDRLGNLWIGTENGLDYFDVRNDKFFHFQHDSQNDYSLSDNRIQSNCIIEDKSGLLWIGTWNGLNCLVINENYSPDELKDKLFFHYKYNSSDLKSLSDSRIISLYEDPKGIIWIGTHGGGLNKMIKKSFIEGNKPELYFERYTEKDGLASNVIYGIQGDENGNLWLSTNKGLSKFNPETEVVRNYYESDGFQSNQYFYGASVAGKYGRLYFGGTNGLNSFVPSELRDNPFVPPIYITELQIFNTPVKVSDPDSPLKKSILETSQIELPYREYVITFEFVALDYMNPEQNKFEYMLEGFDNNWIPSGNRRFVTYPNLGDGQYIFRVKGTNSDGIWNKEGVSLNIIIHPPFWKSWWFLIISFLLVVGLIIYFVTAQIRQLLAVERLRTKLAADLHDNIGSSLTEISILSEVISTRLSDSDKDVLKSLKMISDNSRELIDKMSDIVWLVNPKRDSLYDLILRLEDNYSEILSQTNVSFTSENLRSLERVSLSMEHRQHLYLIFKEGINNAITHGECSEIKLNANVRGKTLYMVLHDNGIGFTEETLKHRGNGLDNMKNRAKKIGGDLEIESVPNKGTDLRFTGII